MTYKTDFIFSFLKLNFRHINNTYFYVVCRCSKRSIQMIITITNVLECSTQIRQVFDIAAYRRPGPDLRSRGKGCQISKLTLIIFVNFFFNAQTNIKINNSTPHSKPYTTIACISLPRCVRLQCRKWFFFGNKCRYQIDLRRFDNSQPTGSKDMTQEKNLAQKLRIAKDKTKQKTKFLL